MNCLLKGNLYKTHITKACFNASALIQQSTPSPEEQITPVATQTVNQNYHSQLLTFGTPLLADQLIFLFWKQVITHSVYIFMLWHHNGNVAFTHGLLIERYHGSKRYKCEGTKEHSHSEDNIFTAY